MTRILAMPNVAAQGQRRLSSIDPQTVRQARNGEEAAFATLYRQTVHHVGRYVGAIVGDAMEAEDAVAQTYADAWRELPGLREPERFEAWLFRIAHNRALDQVRRRRPDPVDPSDDLAGPASDDPAQELLRRERFGLLASALVALPEDQREVVVLRLLRGLPHAEIARQTGRSEGASRIMLHRALQRLRGEFQDDEPAPQPWRRAAG